MIKFRGVPLDDYGHDANVDFDGTFIYGNYEKVGDDVLISSGKFDLEGVSVPDLFAKVDPKTVGQFTGLKDINGKEIYENDIIHFGSIWCVGDECDPREEEHIGAVKYRTDCASYEVNCNGQIFPLMEVINFDGYSVQGNVHENPDLLEEDK